MCTGSHGTKRKLTRFLGISLLEGGGIGNSGCTGVILEKKNVEGVLGRGNRGMEKHNACEKAQQFIVIKT